jgi:hypothetical protein
MSSDTIDLDSDLPEKAGIGVVGYELAETYDVAKEMFLFGIAATLLGAAGFPTTLPDVETTVSIPVDLAVMWTTELMLPSMFLITFFGGVLMTLTAVGVTVKYARAVGVRYYVRSRLPF